MFNHLVRKYSVSKKCVNYHFCKVVSLFSIVSYPLRGSKFFNWINLINGINHFTRYNFNSNAKIYGFISISVWIRHIFFNPIVCCIYPVGILIHIKCLFHSFENRLYLSWIIKFDWHSV